jgi:hypothetical protein
MSPLEGNPVDLLLFPSRKSRNQYETLSTFPCTRLNNPGVTPFACHPSHFYSALSNLISENSNFALKPSGRGGGGSVFDPGKAVWVSYAPMR